MTIDDRFKNIDQRLFEDRRARFRFASASFLPQETEQAIHQRFENQVTKYGNRVAIKTKDLGWTYQDVNRRANRISRSISANCRPGTDQVALLFGHDAAAVCAMIGVLKSAKAYVPIIASNPSVRIRSMLEDARAGLIVTHNQTIGQARALAGNKIQILNVDEISSSVSDENPHNPVRPDSFACILYTSGSTGQPKGVLQTHRNILHQVYSYTSKIGITASDRLSLLPSFDVGAGHIDIYSALLNGASLFPCNMKEEGVQQLTEWLLREGITLYHSVPTLFRHITSHLAEGTLFPEVRVINLGGEHVSLREIELFRKHFSRDSIFVNSLACTETGPFAQYFADHDSEFNEGTVPAGYPTEDMEILLLDDQSNLTYRNGIGEILIKSRYVSPGYWQNPELTSATFKSDSDEPGSRIYYTGDLGRIRRDGMLDYRGRKDSQVKIRGYRVEIPEIEFSLLKHPLIRDAAVVGHDDPTGEEYLTAYVVLDMGEHILATSLRAYLRNILPDYMIPSNFVFLESLPMISNGKLDRNALKAIQPEEMRREDSSRVPENPIEQKLIEIWQHLLKTKQVKVNDNFFDLGGDSLASIELFCWIEKEYGRRISPSMIYEWPTIEQLAAIIAGTPKSKSASCLIPIRIKGSGPPLFVIPSILSNTLFYSEMLKYLDQDQIVYGIEMSEKDLEKPIEEAAAYYVDQIRKAFPAPPYSLIGYSSGGIMALEMGRRFGELNCTAPFLAMIDTVFPFSSESQLPRSGKVFPPPFLKNLPYWLYYFLPYWMSYYIQLARNKNVRQYYKEWQNKILAVRSWLKLYRPEPYSGRVVFYRAEAQGLFTASSYKGWEQICSSLDVYTIPGNHNTMMNKPNVRYLTEKIDSELRKSISLLPDICGKVTTELIC
jgi:amino acid adenylation domain-containing protein